MFEDLKESVRKTKAKAKRWRAFYDEHETEFNREVKPINKEMLLKSGSFILPVAILWIVGYLTYNPILDTAITILVILMVVGYSYQMWQLIRKQENAFKTILKRHHYECYYCGQPMQEELRDKWTNPKDYGYIIAEKPTKSDYDFVHLPQDQDQKDRQDG